MRETLERTRTRITKKHAESPTIEAGLFSANSDELRQFEANRRYWKVWLDNVDDDILREPERVKAFYEVRSTRIEPLGIVYLVPDGKGTEAS